MLTLRELRKRLDVLPKKGAETPKYRGLLRLKKKILISYDMPGATVTVYENGYVLYRNEIGTTVFPFPDSSDYLYESNCDGSEEIVQAECFESAAWYVRLIIEGEDRVIHNSDRRYYAHIVSYSAVAEDWRELSDPDSSAEDALLARENTEAIFRSLNLLTVKQRHVLIENIWENKSYLQIANDLGISRQAVRDMMGNALRQMKKHLAMNVVDMPGFQD